MRVLVAASLPCDRELCHFPLSPAHSVNGSRLTEGGSEAAVRIEKNGGAYGLPADGCVAEVDAVGEGGVSFVGAASGYRAVCFGGLDPAGGDVYCFEYR